jgi:hypothetical protein
VEPITDRGPGEYVSQWQEAILAAQVAGVKCNKDGWITNPDGTMRDDRYILVKSTAINEEPLVMGITDEHWTKAFLILRQESGYELLSDPVYRIDAKNWIRKYHSASLGQHYGTEVQKLKLLKQFIQEYCIALQVNAESCVVCGQHKGSHAARDGMKCPDFKNRTYTPRGVHLIMP